MFCLSWVEYKPCRVLAFLGLFCSLVKTKCLEQCMTHSRCSADMFLNKRIFNFGVLPQISNFYFNLQVPFKKACVLLMAAHFIITKPRKN